MINLRMMGRFGNQLFQYAFAKAYAEKLGTQLHLAPWIGQRLFQNLNDPPVEGALPDWDGSELRDNVTLVGYFQDQKSLDYYRDRIRQLFVFRPEIAGRMTDWPEPATVFQLRRGDFVNSHYPVIGIGSYEKCVQQYGLEGPYKTVCDDYSAPCSIPGAEFLQDFWYLYKAKVLLRANSTFGWWAAAMSGGRVFSPIIEGVPGYKEHHDVPFVEGNWPRPAEISFVTDLHV